MLGHAVGPSCHLLPKSLCSPAPSQQWAQPPCCRSIVPGTCVGQPPVAVVGTGRWGGEGARGASSLAHGTRQLLEKGRSFAWGNLVALRGCAPTGALSSGSGGAGFPRGDVRLLAEGSSHSLMRELSPSCPSTCPLCPWKAPAALSVAPLLCQPWASWPAGRSAAGTNSWRHAGRGQGCVSPLRKPI